nr:MAG TPA: hypothetical protein [Caudoviricetes sp.]
MPWNRNKLNIDSIFKDAVYMSVYYVFITFFLQT